MLWSNTLRKNQYFVSNVKIAHCEYLLGPYLYIDVEDAYKLSTYATKNNINARNFTTDLSDLPVLLKIIVHYCC